MSNGKGWRETTIGEIAEIHDGPHATPRKTDHGPWFLSISSLVGGRLVLAESAHLSEEDYERWTRRVAPRRGDVLFSYETRLGEAALMPDGVRACLGRRMGLLRPREERVDPRFLLYAYLAPEFQHVIQQRKVHGATVDRIPLNEMARWPIRVPSLGQQRAIVAVLGALDDKISVNRTVAQASEELAITLVAAQGSGGVVPLHSMCVVSKARTDPATVDAELVAHFSIPAFDAARLPELCVPSSIRSRKFVLNRPAVLVSKINPQIPRIWHAVPHRGLPSVTSTEFVVLAPREGVRSEEVWATCRQQGFRYELAGRVTGTSGSHQRVRPDEVAGIGVLDPRELSPSTREQVVTLVRMAEASRRELAKLAELRDTVLPRLMSGEIVAPVFVTRVIST